MWKGTLHQWLKADSCPATVNKTFALRPIQLRRKRQLEDWTGPQSDVHSERWLWALTLAWDLNWNDEWRKLPGFIIPPPSKWTKNLKAEIWAAVLFCDAEILTRHSGVRWWCKGCRFGADDVASWLKLLCKSDFGKGSCQMSLRLLLFPFLMSWWSPAGFLRPHGATATFLRYYPAWEQLLEGTSWLGGELVLSQSIGRGRSKGHRVDLIIFHFSFLVLDNKKGPLNIYLFIHEFRTQVPYLHRG